jgi:hypothetical protein
MDFYKCKWEGLHSNWVFFGIYVRWYIAHIMKHRVSNILLWKVSPHMIHVSTTLPHILSLHNHNDLYLFHDKKNTLEIAIFVIFQPSLLENVKIG